MTTDATEPSAEPRRFTVNLQIWTHVEAADEADAIEQARAMTVGECNSMSVQIISGHVEYPDSE